MTNEAELHTRIRQLEDENERLRAVNENARAERAHAYVLAAWQREQSNFQTYPLASIAVEQAIAMEKALADQAERERLGLGKQAEMENGNG